MADQTANAETITGKIIEAMIEAKVLAEAEKIAAAYKVIYKAVDNPLE